MDQFLRDRLYSSIERLPWSGCWIWTKSTGTHGYGDGRYNQKGYLAHRLSYEMHKGPIPAGLQVCHRCDVRPCVNPEHLFLGTNLENIQDSQAKGRRTGPRTRPSGLTYKTGTPAQRRRALAMTKIKEEMLPDLIAMRRAGKTQRQIAALLGVSQASISLKLKNIDS